MVDRKSLRTGTHSESLKRHMSPSIFDPFVPPKRMHSCLASSYIMVPPVQRRGSGLRLEIMGDHVTPFQAHVSSRPGFEPVYPPNNRMAFRFVSKVMPWVSLLLGEAAGVTWFQLRPFHSHVSFKGYGDPLNKIVLFLAAS